jgi:hypothetical protein
MLLYVRVVEWAWVVLQENKNRHLTEHRVLRANSCKPACRTEQVAQTKRKVAQTKRKVTQSRDLRIRSAVPFSEAAKNNRGASATFFFGFWQ